jgi:hypothetical protein
MCEIAMGVASVKVGGGRENREVGVDVVVDGLSKLMEGGMAATDKRLSSMVPNV